MITVLGIMLLVAVPLAVLHPFASALLLCPLSTSQPTTITCGCDPRVETDQAIETKCACPENTEIAQPNVYSCMCLNTSGEQPQSSVCACRTYCESENSTNPSSGISDGQPVSNPQQTSPVTVLSTGQLQACQNLETAIQTGMSRTTSRTQKQLQLISTTADRAEAFYASNHLSYSGYDTLASTVSIDKQAAIQAITNQTNSSFRCSADDPKNALSSYVTNLRTTISSLESYKASVKNLLVGIQSAKVSK